MKWMAASLALLIATPAIAQSSPYKLIILRGNEGITTADYPSAARCEAARTAIQRPWNVRTKAKRRNICQTAA